MKFHGIQLEEGSKFTNPVINSGTSFPGSADEGELFFRSDADTSVKGMHVYVNGSWQRLGFSSATGAYLPLAGGTMTGNLNMSASIIPTANITYDLGSPTMMWRDIYVGPGSIYMNGKKILEDVSDTITFSTDINQNLRIQTSGTGNLELQTGAGGAVIIKGTLHITSGSVITDTAGVKILFGNDIDLGGRKLLNVGNPSTSTDGVNKGYVDGLTSSDSTIVRTTGDQTIAGNKTFSGNVTFSGTTTTVNTQTVLISDNIIELNSSFTTGIPSADAGFQVRRGDYGIVKFIWDETNDRFTMIDGAGTPNYLPLYTQASITAGTLTTSGLGSSSIAGSLSVAGALTAGSLAAPTIALGTGTTTSTVLSAGAMFGERAGALTTAAVTQVSLDSWPVSTYRSAKYVVQVLDTVSGAVMFTEILVSRTNSNNVYISEYGTIVSGTYLVDFTADYDGSANVRLLVTPASTNSTQLKFQAVIFNN
jgi:hypothetical protein